MFCDVLSIFIQSHGSHTQSHLNGNNVLNDVISLYFDRMESVEKPNKQVRFDEVISLFNSLSTKLSIIYMLLFFAHLNCICDEVFVKSDEN